jgi:hypothetical protein
MPSVMIAHHELHHHHKTIMNAVKFHLYNWFMDEDEDEDEDEDYPNPADLPHPNEFIPMNPEEDFNLDEYESNVLNNCCASSLSSEEYEPPVVVKKHKFFDKKGREVNH